MTRIERRRQAGARRARRVVAVVCALLGAGVAAVPSSAQRAAPDMAGALLEDAGERLEHLSGVYLPLYRAKVAVAKPYAYREVALGESAAALSNVDEARESVAAVTRATQGALEPELQQVVEPLADAQLALEGGSEAPAHLERAAETLGDLLARAGLLR
ncbi:MAG: hypothetical protein ACN0LA_13815 [Candidatus Longimicrobiales bacterium M2_2A_002]